MKRTPEQEIRQALRELPPEDLQSVLTLVNSLYQKRAAAMVSAEAQLSDEEHSRILSVLDAVADLSLKQGPAVSNRGHDRDLYGV